MRIVAGQARGRRLQAPHGSGTRPTSERVREAIFSTIHSRLGALESVTVLDLFAGTGALGLEALSRGALSVVFVESHRSAIRVLKDNIGRVGLPGTQVVSIDAMVFAGQAPGSSGVSSQSYPFDLILCDPPYSLSIIRLRELLHRLIHSGWIAPDGEFVIEREARDEDSPFVVDGVGGAEGQGGSTIEFTELDRRTYGDTALWYGRLDGQVA